MGSILTQTEPKILEQSVEKLIYICDKCEYKTERKYDYNNHLKTKRHNNQHKNSCHSFYEKLNFTCCCKKTYKGKNGRKMLYKHRNICEIYKKSNESHILSSQTTTNFYSNENIEKLKDQNNNLPSQAREKPYNVDSLKIPDVKNEIKNVNKDPPKDAYEEYIKTVQTQNELLNKIIVNQEERLLSQEERINETKQETLLIQSQLLEYIKNNQQTQNITNNKTINDNKTININIFLNENCKDALSIEEFVNTLNMTVDKVEEYANAGYVNWVSNVLIDGFRKTDVKKRPIHCSDLKRDVLYVRNENKWEKDLEYKYFDKFLRKISNRYSTLFNEWCSITPLNYILGTEEYETAFKVMCNTHSDEKKQKKILNTVKNKIFLQRSELMQCIED